MNTPHDLPPTLRREPLSESIDRARRDCLRRFAGAALLPMLAGTGLGGLLASAAARGADSCAQTQAPANDPSYSDAMGKVGSVLAAGLNLIPEVGGVLSLLLTVFWPLPSQQPQPDIWSEIKGKVESLIEHDIDNLVLDQMQQSVTGAHDALLGFQQLVQAYETEPSEQLASAIQQSIFSTHQMLLQQAPSFQPSGWAKPVLPYFAQFANMHLVFLRDVIWFGQRRGLVEGVIDYFHQQFDVVVNRYCRHVDATLPSLFQDYEQRFHDARSQLDVVVCDAGGAMVNPSDFVRLASGAWKARKKQVQIHSAYTLMVQDFRDRWPTMLNRLDGAAPPLTRELFYGPYGIPELRDIGLCPGNHCVAPDYTLPQQDYPFVGLPTPAPVAAISYLSGNNEGGITHWLSQIVVNRAGDGAAAPNNVYVLDLRQKSVVAVKVVVAQYKWEDEGFNRYGAAGGHAIARLDLTLDDNSTVQFGEANVTTLPGSNHTTITYVSNDVGLPPGHRLSSVEGLSTVTTLYKKHAHNDHDGHVSAGSLYVGARLIDPDTPLPAGLIANLYVASAKTLTVQQAVAIVARSWANRGKAPSSTRLAAMLEAARVAAAREQWDARRAEFAARLRSAAAKRG